jgi:hypothetical protein
VPPYKSIGIGIGLKILLKIDEAWRRISTPMIMIMIMMVMKAKIYNL